MKPNFRFYRSAFTYDMIRNLVRSRPNENRTKRIRNRTRYAAVAGIADRTPLSHEAAVCSMLSTAIPDVKILGVGSVRDRVGVEWKVVYHRVGGYGLPICLFRHLYCTTIRSAYSQATGRC